MNTCKGQLTIIKGPEANIAYYLTLPIKEIIRKTNGRLSDSFITCTVEKQEDGGARTMCDSSSVIVTYTVGDNTYFFWGDSDDNTKQLDITKFVSYDKIYINVYQYSTPKGTKQGDLINKSQLFVFGNPVLAGDISIIRDGKEDPNFEVWVGTTTDPNNEPEPLWSDDDEDHIGDYYVGTDGRYWEYTEDLTWILITDQVLINILNRIDSNGSSKFSVQCQSIEDIDTAVNNLFAAQEYKIGDLLKVTVNPVEERPDDDIMLTAELAPDDETEVDPGGEDQEIFVDTKMWMCIENKNRSFNWEDWINANDLEKKLEDAGVNVESNSITFTADRMYLKSTSGNTSASINLFRKDQDGQETGGMYLNTSLLKIDNDVEINGKGTFTGKITATALNITDGNGNFSFSITELGNVKRMFNLEDNSTEIIKSGLSGQPDNTPVMLCTKTDGTFYIVNMTLVSNSGNTVYDNYYKLKPDMYGERVRSISDAIEKSLVTCTNDTYYENGVPITGTRFLYMSGELNLKSANVNADNIISFSNATIITDVVELINGGHLCTLHNCCTFKVFVFENGRIIDEDKYVYFTSMITTGNPMLRCISESPVVNKYSDYKYLISNASGTNGLFNEFSYDKVVGTLMFGDTSYVNVYTYKFKNITSISDVISFENELDLQKVTAGSGHYNLERKP